MGNWPQTSNVLMILQVVSGSSDESESVPFIDDDSSESSSKDRTDNASATTASTVTLVSTAALTTPALPKPTFLDLKQGMLSLVEKSLFAAVKVFFISDISCLRYNI